MNMSDMNQYLSKNTNAAKKKKKNKILFLTILLLVNIQVISFGAPITKVIQLFSLYNQIQNGMKTKLYDFYRREILHMYGTQHIMTLENCEKQVQLEKNLMILIYGKKLKNLCVINEDMLIMMLQKIFYMFFLRLLQQQFEYLQKTHGAHWFCKPQKNYLGDLVIQQNLNQLKGEEVKEDQNQIYVIYIVGGITYGEIAAIRWLGLRYKKDIKICTTHIINGDKLVQEMIQNQ